MGGKPPEVIDAHPIEKLRSPSDTSAPKRKTASLHGLPVVQGIPPKLSCFREIVRGNACLHLERSIWKQQKFSAVAPDFHTIVCDENRNVPDEFNAPFVRSRAHRLPLSLELPLHKTMQIDVV